MWYLEYCKESNEVTLMNDGHKMMADVDGKLLPVGPVVDVKGYQKNGKDYVVVRVFIEARLVRPRKLHLDFVTKAAHKIGFQTISNLHINTAVT